MVALSTNQSEKNQGSQNVEENVEDIFEFQDSGGQTPEQVPVQPEQQPEQPREAEPRPEVRPEQQPEQPHEDEQSRQQYAPPPADQPAAAQPVEKDPIQAEIENVLSEHLDDIFASMTPQQQMEFQQKGEETAAKIKVLLEETKVKVREVLNLIKAWLQLIPGVNKFFLEQEAKIKTDRLLNWREQHKR